MNQGRKRALPSAAPSSADAAPLLAGYISGSFSVLVGHPFDSLRVLQQQQQARMASTFAPLSSQRAATRQAIGCPLNRAHLVRPDMAQSAARRMALRAASSSTSTNASTATAASRTLATRSILVLDSLPSMKSLYRGIAGPLASVGGVQAIGFATYDLSRKKIRAARSRTNASPGSKSNDDCNDSLQDVAMAAFASGSVVSVITAPLVAIKIRQQLSGGGFWRVVGDLFQQKRKQGKREGGIRGLYHGFSAHFVLESLGRAIFFSCYEGIKSVCFDADLSLGQRMAAAAASGVISTSLLLPVDAIRTRVNSSQVSPLGATGTKCTASQAAIDLWQIGGARAFFRGYWVSLVRAGPVSALSLPAYDLTLEWLNPNDSSCGSKR